MNDIDVMLDWIIENVHYVDNIRRVDDHWSMRLWLTRQTAMNPGLRFTGKTVEATVEAALDHVLAWRIDQRTRTLGARTPDMDDARNTRGRAS